MSVLHCIVISAKRRDLIAVMAEGDKVINDMERETVLTDLGFHHQILCHVGGHPV